MPPKVYHGPAEPGVDVMPEGEQRVNRELAAWLFDNAMGGMHGTTLDIGSKVPVLASALHSLGCVAFAIDAIGGVAFGAVMSMPFDFERESTWPISDPRGYQLVTLVHTFEHFYDPVAAMQKLRKLCAYDGRVFIRMPDNSVAGFERDLTPHHYAIHPFFHSVSSVCEILARLRDAFVIESMRVPGPGQRDLILRPIA